MVVVDVVVVVVVVVGVVVVPGDEVLAIVVEVVGSGEKKWDQVNLLVKCCL